MDTFVDLAGAGKPDRDGQREALANEQDSSAPGRYARTWPVLRSGIIIQCLNSLGSTADYQEMKDELSLNHYSMRSRL
jgi:hypothetical protein